MCNYSDIVEERGIEKGKLIQLIDCVCKKLRKGKTIELIAEELEEEVDVIEKIYETAKKYAPECDVEEILKAVQEV